MAGLYADGGGLCLFVAWITGCGGVDACLKCARPAYFIHLLLEIVFIDLTVVFIWIVFAL